MKRKVNVWDYAGKIAEAMNPGILATTKAGATLTAVSALPVGYTANRATGIAVFVFVHFILSFSFNGTRDVPIKHYTKYGRFC